MVNVGSEMDTSKKLRAIASSYDDISNELELLKAELQSRSDNLADKVANHESRIYKAEKAINKELSSAEKFVASSHAFKSLKLGDNSPQVSACVDYMVAQHLERSGFRSAAQLMATPEIQHETETGIPAETIEKNEEHGTDQQENKSQQLFDEVCKNTLSVKVAAKLGVDRKMYEHLQDVTIAMGFYRALSEGAAEAYSFLQSQDLRSKPQSITEMVIQFSGKLATMSSLEAREHYLSLRRSSLRKILLYYGANRVPLIPVDEPSQKAHFSDLKLLTEASQNALNTSFKELQLLKWSNNSELPRELTKESEKFYFHPVFVCPVTQEQLRGPSLYMLKCGHLLSDEAHSKVCKGGTVTKCPYCPTKIYANEVSRMYLSEVI